MSKVDDEKNKIEEEKILTEKAFHTDESSQEKNSLHEQDYSDQVTSKNDAEELDDSNDTEEKTVEEKLEENICELRDEKLRLLAEMENLRKRTDKERIDSIKYGSINLARDILSPDDNLTRALEAIPEQEKNSETVNNLIEGLKMVQKEFSTILEKHGVKKIKALNMRFDHNLHQAMIEIENDEVEHGLVIQEMQSGYTMHDRLLRPSMVGVSKKGQKEQKEKEDDKDDEGDEAKE